MSLFQDSDGHGLCNDQAVRLPIKKEVRVGEYKNKIRKVLCDNCEFTTNLLRKMELHLKTKHRSINRPAKKIRKRENKKTFICLQEGCNFACTTRRSLNSHLAKIHGDTSNLMHCPHCDFSTAYEDSLRPHIARHSNINHFTCSHNGCGFSTAQRRTLKSHMAKIHGDVSNLRKCSHCQFTTVFSSYLKKHENRHLPPDERHLKCTFVDCGYSCLTTKSLQEHYGRKHGETENLKKCPHCDYSTTMGTRLKRHIQTHLPPQEKWYKCSHEGCNSSFILKASLNNHLVKKHKETFFKCPHCEFLTTATKELIKHIPTHVDVKSFECSYEGCGFTYSSTSEESLRNHLFHKHGESKGELNKCPLCDFSTVFANGFANHMKTHLLAEKKSFTCGFEGCGYKSKTIKSLENHTAKKH